MTKARLVWMLVCVSTLAQAQREITVAELTTFIKSSVQSRTSTDSQVADYVRKVKLTEKLDNRTVEELRDLGAGPRTVAALRVLSSSSTQLATPGPAATESAVVEKPAPEASEQKRIIAGLTEYARNYTKNLPNFLCTQVTYQRVDPSGKESWTPAGTVQEQLTYVDGREDYKVVMVNDRPAANISHARVGGNKSSGEFGSMLAEIFDPESHTEFVWSRWTTWRGRPMYVFSFRVKKEYSQYQIFDGESRRSVVPGYSGLVYGDRNTGMVMRIVMEPYGLPSGFPIRDVKEVLDYDFQKIGDREYVLPLKAELRSRNGKTSVLNQIEFRLYRKFGSETSISFDKPEN